MFERNFSGAERPILHGSERIITPDDFRRIKDDGKCPACGAPEEDRVPSSGFGHPHPVCKRCGHRFVGVKD